MNVGENAEAEGVEDTNDDLVVLPVDGAADSVGKLMSWRESILIGEISGGSNGTLMVENLEYYWNLNFNKRIISSKTCLKSDFN
jgi:hypothetical protein